MKRGIFYMLTSTEISLLKSIVQDYIDMDGADRMTAQDAIEILNKIKPIDVDEAFNFISEEEKEEIFND